MRAPVSVRPVPVPSPAALGCGRAGQRAGRGRGSAGALHRPRVPDAGAEPGLSQGIAARSSREAPGRERGRQGRSWTLTLQSPPGGQAEGDGPHDGAPASGALQRSHQREADAPGVAFKWLGRPARPEPGGCLPQRPLPRFSPSSSSRSRRGAGAAPSSPPQRPSGAPPLTPRDLPCGREMQLAEEGKALPGRRPSPSREMSAMGATLPGRSLELGAEPGMGASGHGGWF